MQVRVQRTDVRADECLCGDKEGGVEGKGPPLVEVAHVLGELLLPGLRVAAGLGALDEDRADLS